MTGDTPKPLCPHCGATLLPFQLPDNTGWDSPFHFACFNDECPYFRRGWAWMFDHYGVKSSYRFRIDPVSGTDSPLPVWSKDAIKDRILDAEIIAGQAGDDLSTEEEGNRQKGRQQAAGNRQQMEEEGRRGQQATGEKEGNRQKATGKKEGSRQQATGNSRKKKEEAGNRQEATGNSGKKKEKKKALDGASQGSTPAGKPAGKGKKT